MRVSSALRLGALALALLLAACATREPARRLAPPPPATPAQIEKEMQYLQQHFLSDVCLVDLRRLAPPLTAADRQPGPALYAVEFAPSAMSKGSALRLQVSERDRQGWLYSSGSSGGWYQVRGPLPLWSCLAAAMG